MADGTILLVGLSPSLHDAFGIYAAHCGIAVVHAEEEIPFFANPSELRLCVIEAHGSDDDAYDRIRAQSKKVGASPIVVLARGLRASTGARLERLGIADVFDLPAAAEDVVALTFQHIASSEGSTGTDAIAGESSAMRAIRQRVRVVAQTRSTVLLLGETGTGKGLLAKTIHELSPYSRAPFIHVDCAALSSTVIESELFGHERGSFTGASELRRGRFELAGQGTIFLDEIGDLEPGLQAKLLRVLQDRTYERVGGTKTLEMNARVIAATNQNLSQAVREGRFRRDLYYRLNVIQIQIPSLKERPEDIPVLARGALNQLSKLLAVPRPRVSDAFYERLRTHSWPGNVRELMNVLERCLIQRRADVLVAEDLDEIFDQSFASGHLAEETSAIPEELPEPGSDEKSFLTHVLRNAGWNVTRAARRLGMPRSTLRYKLKQYDLEGLIPKD